MTQPLVYIAGPYSAPSPTIRAWNVDRARLLARLALACGYAPIEPHSSIHAGVYGDDSDPQQRARGMAATMAICTAITSARGGLWALLRDDGSWSEGTKREHDASTSSIIACRSGTWAGWRYEAARSAPDLLPEWDRLAVRPDAVGEWAIDEPVSSRWYVGAPSGGGECAALVLIDGWTAYTVDGVEIASGPETGALGRDAADAALRRAGILS